MDEEAKKKATRERVRRYRALHKSVTSEESVTPHVEPEALHTALQVAHDVTPSVTNVAPVIHMLADPIKREKLRAISESLKAHKLGEHVWLGIGNGVNFETVGRLLEAFPLKVVTL